MGSSSCDMAPSGACDELARHPNERDCSFASLTIYYARFKLETGQIPGQTSFSTPDQPLFRQAVAEATSVERYQHDWVFGNLVFDDEVGRVTGLLGYPAQEQIVRQDLDPETHDFVQKVFELPDATAAAFILDYNTGALAFDGDAGTTPGGFLRTFLALLETARRGSYSGELIQVAKDYREFLRVVDKVTKVAFEVRPTNPRDRAIFRPLDVGMKAVNAERQKVTLENKEEGLEIEPPPNRDVETNNPAVMGIEMNEEGYGRGYRIDGEQDGQTLRFDSRSGGLFKDVVEDAPDSPVERIDPLREHFGHRLALLSNPDAPRRSPNAADETNEPDDIEADDIETDDDHDDQTDDEAEDGGAAER